MEARSLFAGFVGQDAGIALRNGRILYVEVFARDGEIILGRGWSVVFTMAGAEEGDVVFFAAAANAETVEASFFDPFGCELMPSFNRLIQGSSIDDVTALAYTVGPGLDPTQEEHAVLREIFVRGGSKPMYVCRMNPTNVFKGMLYFNRHFSVKNVPIGSTMASIQAEGTHIWVAGKITRGADKIARISSGWLQFAKEMGLRGGDLCAIRIAEHGGGLCVDVQVVPMRTLGSCPTTWPFI